MAITAQQIITEQLRQLNDRIAGCQKRLASFDQKRLDEETELAELEAAYQQLSSGVGVDPEKFRASELKIKTDREAAEAAGV